MKRAAMVVLLLCSLCACAGPRTAGLCPEAKNLRCLTRTVCSPDMARGCQVCSCEPALTPDRTREQRSGETLSPP